jgi:hypothetical protein
VNTWNALQTHLDEQYALSFLLFLQSRDYSLLIGGAIMSMMIIAISLAALIWGSPVQTMAAVQPETALGLQQYMKQVDFSGEIIPASARFSLRVGPKGSFAYDRFRGRGFHKFGNRNFHPYKYGRYPAYKYPYRYTPRPYLYGRNQFNRDRFFSDRSSRFGSPSPYYSPFGTRRPGW